MSFRLLGISTFAPYPPPNRGKEHVCCVAVDRVGTCWRKYVKKRLKQPSAIQRGGAPQKYTRAQEPVESDVTLAFHSLIWCHLPFSSL